MKVTQLKNAIIDLIRYAGKEAYLIRNHLFLEIDSDGSRFSLYTYKDGVISLTIYFSDAIYYRFLIDSSDLLVSERGSTPELIDRYGVNYILNLLENASVNLIKIGKEAVDTGNYKFRDTSKDEDIEDVLKTNSGAAPTTMH